jgi:hypothetical protein
MIDDSKRDASESHLSGNPFAKFSGITTEKDEKDTF